MRYLTSAPIVEFLPGSCAPGPGVRARLTGEGLIDELRMCARPAVRGYGDEVVVRAGLLGLTVVVAHPPGPCEVRLKLRRPANDPTLVQVGWRVDTGWFYLVPGPDEATSGNIRYRRGTNQLDRLIPDPARVADWCASLSRSAADTTVTLPPLVGHATRSTTVALLHSYMRAVTDPYACWTHRRLSSFAMPHTGDSAVTARRLVDDQANDSVRPVSTVLVPAR